LEHGSTEYTAVVIQPVLKKSNDTDEAYGAWAGGGEQEPGEERAHAGEDEGVAPPLPVTQQQLHVLVLPATKRTGITKKFNKFS
jgi:hypothetical protein